MRHTYTGEKKISSKNLAYHTFVVTLHSTGKANDMVVIKKLTGSELKGYD